MRRLVVVLSRSAACGYSPPGGCAERVEEAHRVLDEVEAVVRGVLP
jgi:hypothetical protein